MILVAYTRIEERAYRPDRHFVGKCAISYSLSSRLATFSPSLFSGFFLQHFHHGRDDEMHECYNKIMQIVGCDLIEIAGKIRIAQSYR